MEVTLIHKGKSATATATTSTSSLLPPPPPSTIPPAPAARAKNLSKGKQLRLDAELATAGVKPGAKLMVWRRRARRSTTCGRARSDDPRLCRRALADSRSRARRRCGAHSRTPSSNSAGLHRARGSPLARGDGVPHAFEARKLLLMVATDPAICIMRQRRWTVGARGLDPVDDRLAEKMEGGGKRLLGYNTNHGAQIHVRLGRRPRHVFAVHEIIDTTLRDWRTTRWARTTRTSGT